MSHKGHRPRHDHYDIDYEDELRQFRGDLKDRRKQRRMRKESRKDRDDYYDDYDYEN